ncbi:pair-rule protein odd-paired-like [Lytechinus variegatus]|uniref:pair-rule protein odd-paired-like n=1 Tax=Lytechinus variegatus TaxID=7654 RepID=UPI001BB29644|nr:pair-rule protein odd-paired-like [Lytechinus variegatus]
MDFRRSEMTLTKASQKRSRSRDEDGEDILPRTKRREYNFERSYQHQELHESPADGAGEPHHSQAASSTSPLATSPQAGSTACYCLPPSHNSADITAALHNTHLDRHGYHHHHNPSPSPPPPSTTTPSFHHHHHQQQHHHPVLLKDAGILPSSQHPSLGPLPDVVHETSETCYCHVNRLLRAAHFERLKRLKDPRMAETGSTSAFN